MEWWKLFGGTFILIFLAELGDKTQLAAMAKTADAPDSSMAKWVVFIAASAALVASTFIAVFLGHFIKAVIPDDRYIKIASGVLFLVFGGMILFEALGGKREAPAPSAAAHSAQADPGYAGRLALMGAMEFESYAADRYRRLAEKVADPRLIGLLRTLASEEEGHLASLRNIPDSATSTTKVSGRIPAGVGGNELKPSAGDADILNELIRHEEATAEFYQHLADRSIIASIQGVFARLADEERSHASRLSELLRSGLSDRDDGTPA